MIKISWKRHQKIRHILRWWFIFHWVKYPEKKLPSLIRIQRYKTYKQAEKGLI